MKYSYSERQHSKSNLMIVVVPAESPICDGVTQPDAVFLVLLFRAKITVRTAEFNNTVECLSLHIIPHYFFGGAE